MDAPQIPSIPQIAAIPQTIIPAAIQQLPPQLQPLMYAQFPQYSPPAAPSQSATTTPAAGQTIVVRTGGGFLSTLGSGLVSHFAHVLFVVVVGLSGFLVWDKFFNPANKPKITIPDNYKEMIDEGRFKTWDQCIIGLVPKQVLDGCDNILTQQKILDGRKK